MRFLFSLTRCPTILQTSIEYSIVFNILFELSPRESSCYISQHLEVDPPTEVAGNGGPDVGALVRQHRLQVPVAARDEGEPRADHGLRGEPRVEVGEDRLEGVLAGDRVLGPNSIEKCWLEFRLEKPLEFWLEIPYTKKKLKNG